jgi:hypothetical protein
MTSAPVRGTTTLQYVQSERGTWLRVGQNTDDGVGDLLYGEFSGGDVIRTRIPIPVWRRGPETVAPIPTAFADSTVVRPAESLRGGIDPLPPFATRRRAR